MSVASYARDQLALALRALGKLLREHEEVAQGSESSLLGKVLKAEPDSSSSSSPESEGKEGTHPFIPRRE
eukprot:5554570-Amphidinium_carterae.1